MLENHDKIRGILAIHKAIVPIIKLMFDGVQLDIGFSSGNFEILFELDNNEDERIFSDNILLNMDENTIKSFNAYRNAHILLRCVSSVDKVDDPEVLLPVKER